MISQNLSLPKRNGRHLSVSFPRHIITALWHEIGTEKDTITEITFPTISCFKTYFYPQK